MPRPKQMVKRAVVQVAERRRTCKFSNEPILKDERCLVVYEDSRDRSCYSVDTARQMIALARKQIDDIEEALGLR